MMYTLCQILSLFFLRFCILMVASEGSGESDEIPTAGIFNDSVLRKIKIISPSNCFTPHMFIFGEADRGEFPHQALLGYAKLNNPNEIEFLCGGSLISNWYVLTAAHCRTPQIVRLGEYNLDDDDDGQQDFDVAEFIQHPSYTSSQSYHDIALAKLTKKVQFNDNIRPASLWEHLPFHKSTVIATGYGRTSNKNNLMSSKLIKIGLHILDREQCQTRYRNDIKFPRGIIPEQLCIGSQGDSKDTCNGDSGGPVQISRDPHTCNYYIVGITTVGKPICGAGNSTAVYTQVASYHDWIKKIVW